MVRTSNVVWKKRLVGKITCPYCWREFPAEDIQYIARHPELVGDPVLGANEYLRFSPARFTVEGHAMDPRGQPTADLACPRCHLQISEMMLEVPPLVISLIGSPASGKSYFLATMAHQLRMLMPQANLTFTDAAPAFNRAIREYEETLFGDPTSLDPTEIRKTQADDPSLHKVATIDGVPTRIPLPLQFSIWPTREHVNYGQPHRIGRVLILYDNAGEDFLPGAEDRASEAVKHLARSDIIFMLFDPTQESRLRGMCDAGDPQVSGRIRPAGGPPLVVHQETILREAAVRARRLLGTPQSQPLDKPIVIIIPKFDTLSCLPEVSLDREPYSGLDGSNGGMRLKMADVERASDAIRGFLRQRCPDFVATAESLSHLVRYVAVSSLGRSPELVERGGTKFYGIRPVDIKPRWVTVPVIYSLTKWASILFSDRKRSP
jgi:hypothetical protein